MSVHHHHHHQRSCQKRRRYDNEEEKEEGICKKEEDKDDSTADDDFKDWDVGNWCLIIPPPRHPAAAAGDDSQAETDTTSTSIGRKRGRPRTTKEEDLKVRMGSSTAAPKRGQPRNSKVDDGFQMELTETTSTTTIRNRGRPRKQKEDDDSQTGTDTISATTVRKRGGPRKMKDDKKDDIVNKNNAHGAKVCRQRMNSTIISPTGTNANNHDDDDDKHGADDNEEFKDWSEGNWCLLLPPEMTDDATDGDTSSILITSTSISISTITKPKTAKAKRGRPKKKSPKPQTDVPVDDDAAIIDPKKIPTTSTTAATTTTTTTNVKARRGRQRKNAPEPQEDVPTDDDAVIVDMEKITKTTTITETAKARRGRPRKKVPEPPHQEVPADNDVAMKNSVKDWKVCIPHEKSASFPNNFLKVLEMIDGFSAEVLPMTMMILPKNYSFSYEMYHHQRHGARKGIQTRNKLRKRQYNNSNDVDGCNSSCGDVRLAWHKHKQSWSPSNKNDLYSFVKVLIEIACDGFGGAAAKPNAKINWNNKKGPNLLMEIETNK